MRKVAQRARKRVASDEGFRGLRAWHRHVERRARIR
jgi:hypothetical protein